MIWLVLEGVLALSLFVFIIWWTMPRRPKDDKASGSKSRAAEAMNQEKDKKQ